MPVDLSKCLTCGALLPVIEFQDVDAPSNHPHRKCLMCRACQLNNEEKNFPPASPWRRAEAEIERLYGVKPEAWLNDRASPFGALFYALAARAAVRPKRGKITEKRRNPLHYGSGSTITVEDAMRLCSNRGYHTIQGRSYDDEQFARGAAADVSRAA